LFLLKKSISVGEIALALKLNCIGNSERLINGVGSFNDATENILCFANKITESNESKAIVIAKKNENGNVSYISSNPRLAFIQVLEWLELHIGFITDEAEAKVHETAIIGQNVVLESGVTIGANTVIEHNVTIMKGTVIGENCLIRGNVNIGGSGFGFERDESGKSIKFIHLGRVLIGNSVEVGAGSCIAKGTMGNTVIEDNVKIDNLVQVAHNSYLKSGSFILSGAAIGGSVVVGKNAWVGPNSVIYQKKNVGNNAIIGMGSVVLKNVKPLDTVFGNPSKSIK
jgi:UDP-3-O-[3-hydroxymyristoyl] glucosamine N-acyltransferase